MELDTPLSLIQEISRNSTERKENDSITAITVNMSYLNKQQGNNLLSFLLLVIVIAPYENMCHIGVP